jgi:hypothetical protein
MNWRRKKRLETALSPYLAKIWAFIRFRYLVLATEGYIVFIDDDLEVDWKSTNEWDKLNEHRHQDFTTILNKAASVEASEWDYSDEQKTLNFKRQIGEGIARGLDGNFVGANEMLDAAEVYRKSTLASARRRGAITEQVKIKNSWRHCFRTWTVVHYFVGICAIVLSTLLASKPGWLDQNWLSVVGWMVAALTGLLTFLTPDKKATKYIRAWSVLNTQITRYNSDATYTIDDVLDAYQVGQNIIHETGVSEQRRRRG